MANLKAHTQIELVLPAHEYTLSIGHHLLADIGFLRSCVSSTQVFVVTNQIVAPLYLHFLKSAFADLQCDVLVLPDGESFKNQDSLNRIYDDLVSKGHHRDTTLIALGGGVIGDIAGFAASTYQRGIPFIQIPTTLLAQVDASVGGKTAINHPSGKNLIGSFYQPKAVIIDVNTLTTLPIRAFRSGLAEMIKYGLLVGGPFLERLEQGLAQGLSAQSADLSELIAECCRIKAQFVIADERDFGVRALLNLGHTFAHALEAVTDFTHWLHGEAVAIGLYCAAVLSYTIGLLDFSNVEQVERMLLSAGLPHKIPKTINLDKLMGLMRLDKKIKNNDLPFIVIRSPGACYLQSKITEHEVLTALLASVEGE